MKTPLTTLVLLSLAAGALAGPEVVTFRTEDGLEIQGDLYAAKDRGAPGVIGLHMYRSDRSAWAPLAPFLEQAGIAFLAIDLRGHGGSRFQKGQDLGEKVAARDPALFNAMVRDAQAAREFLERRGVDPDRVAFAGASVGCSVAIHAASEDERIRGALLLTPGENYLGVPTMEHLATWWGRPLWIWTSEEEADRGPRAIAEKAGGRLNVLDYADVHGTRMLGRVKAAEMQMAAWLADLLGAPVAVDGKLSEAERDDTNIVSRSFGFAGHTLEARVRGVWLHLVLRPGEGPAPKELAVAVGGGGRPGAAVGFGLGFVGRRAYTSDLRFRDGEWWKAKVNPLPAKPRVRGAWDEVAELLIPLEGITGLRIAVATSPEPDGELTWHQPPDPARAEEWLKVR